MRDAAPVNIPLGTVTVIVDGKPQTVQISITNPAWIQWFQKNLDLYRTTNRYLDPRFVNYGKFEPEEKYEGLMAYADGTNWNPGGGAGDYVYEQGIWQLVRPDKDLELYMQPDYGREIKKLYARIAKLEQEIMMVPDYQRQIAMLKQEIKNNFIISAMEN